MQPTPPAPARHDERRGPGPWAWSLACLALAGSPGLVWAQNSFGTPPAPAAPPKPAPAAQPAQPATAAPATPAQAGAPELDAELARMEAIERRDMGVPAKSQLHEGPMSGPTPNSIPGGRLVTTRQIYELVRRTQGDRQTAPRSFDILGGPESLPGALLALPAGQGGSFDDVHQREFGQFLAGVTQGRKDLPMIFYCRGLQCWTSYNAALRAIQLGYTQVLWYRGGIEAWTHARLPVQRREPPPQGQDSRPSRP